MLLNIQPNFRQLCIEYQQLNMVLEEDICTDLSNLGVAMVEELDELQMVSINLYSRQAILTSSSSVGILKYCLWYLMFSIEI